MPRRPGPFRRCLRATRGPLALALLFSSVPGALLLPSSAAAQTQPVAALAAQEQAASVNINTASAEELAARLNGVGVSKAEAIVRYREQFGPFGSVDELAEVNGIGTSTVERNRAVITLR